MVDSRHYFRIAFALTVILFLLVSFALLVSMQFEPESPKEQKNPGAGGLPQGGGEGSQFSVSDVNIGWEQEEGSQGREESEYSLSGVIVEVKDENQPA